MKEYDFEIKETATLRYSVAAKNANDAMKCIQAKLKNGEILMDEGSIEWEIVSMLDKGVNNESR